MISKKAIINGMLVFGVILSLYFLHLALTPEGYTGIFIVFQYHVHNARNPAIFLALFVVALLLLNWKNLRQTKQLARVIPMGLLAGVILFGVFFFLTYKQHNRLPWERPNIILIDVDTLRGDHISAFGSDKARTPNIDQLAEKGLYFDNAFAHIPITMPSHSSTFTSRLPHDVAVFNNENDFNYKEQTIAEILKDEGYSTAAMISLGVLKKTFKLSRGFDVYNDQLPGDGRWYNTADVITERGIDWLQQNAIGKESPFFLWLHYQDPHEPYATPNVAPDSSFYLDEQEVGQVALDGAKYSVMEMDVPPGYSVLTVRCLAEEKVTPYLLHFSLTGDIENEPFPAHWQATLKEAREQGEEHFRKIFEKLQSDQFLSDFNIMTIGDIEVSLRGDWTAPDTASGRPRRNLKRRNEIRIVNNSQVTKKLKLKVRGGLNKPLLRARADYASEVEFADREIGRLLEFLKLQELDKNTIVVLMSDHGEELREHGYVGHIHNLYTESLHVPLIIFDPASPHKNKRISKLARLIDVVPTLLDLAGIAQPDYMQGRTLMEYVTRNRYPQRYLKAETFQPEARENKLAYRRDQALSIHNPDAQRIRQFEMYDLAADPEQWKNLMLSKPPADARQRMEELEKLSESIVKDSATGEMTEDRAEMLADLGYVGGNVSAPAMSDVGEPWPFLLERMKHLMDNRFSFPEPLPGATVETVKSGEGAAHLHIKLDAEVEDAKSLIMALQFHVVYHLMPNSKQFPMRLTVTNHSQLIFDQAYPGDISSILDLYLLRAMQLLSLQPGPASFAPAMQNFIEVAEPEIAASVAGDK
jgi:arylsulfatase A-like enzyme